MRMVTVLVTWLFIAVLFVTTAHAEPTQTWTGTVSHHDDDVNSDGEFTLTVGPDGTVSGQGAGEAFAGIEESLDIQVSGRREGDRLVLRIDASGFGVGWTIDATAPIVGATASASLNAGAPRDVEPRWSVDLRCERC